MAFLIFVKRIGKIAAASTAVFLLAFQPALSANDHLVINEIQITGGKGNTDNDFVELYNPTGKKINLKGYRLVKRAKNGVSDTTIKSWASDAFIASQGYFLWANNEDGFASKLGADAATSATLAADNAIALRKGSANSGEVIDSVGWGENQSLLIEGLPYPDNPGANESLERSAFADTDDNALDFFLSDTPSPNHSDASGSEGKEDESEAGGCDSNVRLSELLPNPKDEKTEYIELENRSDNEISLSGWMLRDASKTGKYAFPEESSISANGFLVIKRSDFKFALNNSAETVRLLCPNGEEADSISYRSAREEISYSRDGDSWRWTSHQTPGSKNRFDKLPKAKMKISDGTYVNSYIDFKSEIKNSKKYKFRWDFGDQHKSYLAKPRHRYEKTGTYTVTLLIRGKAEDIELKKKIRVTDFPEKDVSLVAFCPNPEGKDTDNEWVEIRNGSKKKLDLSGWSLASGNKKLINHPFLEKIIIKPGKTFRITHEQSRFSLNNKQGSLELRYPDGKAADTVDYDHGRKAAAEDELYVKEKGKWHWVAESKISTEAVPEKLPPAILSAATEHAVPEPIRIDPELIGGKSATNKEISLPECLLAFDSPERLIRQLLRNPRHPAIIGIGNRYLFVPPPHRISPFARFANILLMNGNRSIHRLESLF